MVTASATPSSSHDSRTILGDCELHSCSPRYHLAGERCHLALAGDVHLAGVGAARNAGPHIGTGEVGARDGDRDFDGGLVGGVADGCDGRERGGDVHGVVLHIHVEDHVNGAGGSGAVCSGWC